MGTVVVVFLNVQKPRYALLKIRIMYFEHFKAISNIHIGYVITCDKIMIFAFVDESTSFPQNPRNHTDC